jgi:hypothetical protein
MSNSGLVTAGQSIQDGSLVTCMSYEPFDDVWLMLGVELPVKLLRKVSFDSLEDRQ